MKASFLSKEVDFELPIAALVIFVSLSLVVFRAVCKNRQNASGRYPPLAPTGLLETIKMVSGSEYPWFLLRTAHTLKSRIFRLSLPIFGTPMVIVVGELETVRQVLTDTLSKKPLALYSSFNNINGGSPSMFTLNGEHWHARRKGVAPAFSSNHVRRMNNVALKKTEIWIREKLRPMIEEDESFDVAKEMVEITLSAVCETAFEYNMPKEEQKILVSELEVAFKEFLFKSTVNPLRRWFGVFLSERRRAFAAAEKLNKIAMNIIESYRMLEGPLKGTMIQQIMTSDAYKNDDERAADVLGLLIAGHDTTGYSISWILLELARNPAELSRLRESLCCMSSEEWSRSEVLKMVIKEGIRLHPVSAGGSTRVIGRDMITSTMKMLMPKGSIIFMPFILLLRNSDIYGDNVDAFCPSRWEHPTKEMLDAFLPFSLGKQNCVGQSLANAEMHCIVARICSEFDLEVEEEGSVEYSLTLKPEGARLKARKLNSS